MNFTKLMNHVLAMSNDTYLEGHSEWAEIVRDAENLQNENETYKEKLWNKIGESKAEFYGWEVGQEETCGCIFFQRGDEIIYATPMWEQDETIDIVSAEDTENLYSVKFELSYNIDIDVKNYLSIMSLQLKGL
jgi:hypothetical protein